ncbi:MAG: RNA polymerase sigma-70 factor [Ferruginibacter sp.]|nr:RNA polymerase sigma-70 factor [Ferruginibacter sp.]
MLATPLFNEKELLFQIGAGEEPAFCVLYKHYYGSVSKIVVGYVKSPELAEDISQEIFLKIWENRGRLQEIRSFRDYLFIVTYNYTMNVLKAAARKEAGLAEIIRHYQAGRICAEEEILHHEYQRFLDKTLASLPSRSREVFNLCRKQAKSYNEVALQLGISRNAVKNHMVHSMKMLKRSVETELGISLGMLLGFILLN